MEGEDSVDAGLVKRLSIDCKATVKIGGYSRGGKTRCDSRAADHDMGCEEKNVPFGVVDEDGGALYLTFGSSFKTSDFIADSLVSWWESKHSLTAFEALHDITNRIDANSFELVGIGLDIFSQITTGKWSPS